MIRLFAAARAMVSLIAPGAHAQTFPARPVTIVAPYPAGGVTDGMARVIGEQLGRELRQSVVIDNVGGGGIVPAAESYRQTRAKQSPRRRAWRRRRRPSPD